MRSLRVDERQRRAPQLAAEAAPAHVRVHLDVDAGRVPVVPPGEVDDGPCDYPVAVAGDPQRGRRTRVVAELQRGEQAGSGPRREVRTVGAVACRDDLGKGVGGVQVEVQRVDALEVHRAIQRHRRRDG